MSVTHDQKGFDIRLSVFEGPFDLLLFFIERDELDIYDIPISKITEDFLNYLHQMKAADIDLASEFMLTAATLMRIKAKTLLPRPELNEKGEEIDPREELVKHLLEYKKYKSVIAELQRMEDIMFSREARGNVIEEIERMAKEMNIEAELEPTDLYKLLKAFQRVLKRAEEQKNRPVHQVVRYPYTIAEQRAYILQKTEESRNLSFQEIISENSSRIAILFNFLAILELIQLRLVKITSGIGFNNFWLERLPEEALA